MVIREDDAANVTFPASKLKPTVMDCSIVDVHKEFMVGRTFAKMWLETKGVSDNNHYIFILQLLGKEGLHHLEYPNNNDKERADYVWETFKGSFRQTSSFGSYRNKL